MAIEELRCHKLKQAEQLLRLGTRATDDHHVVAREDGLPIQPRTLTHEFQVFLRKYRLQRMRLHDLRHTHATHMLQSGIHPKVAQERLGHSSIGITLDLYSQVLPGMQDEAAQRIDAAMRAAMEKTKG